MHRRGLFLADAGGSYQALVDLLGISRFHLTGVSMGGMISQDYVIARPGDLKSVTLACTHGRADAFCQTMLAMRADLAKLTSLPFVMRDAALWAFTGPFFEERSEDATAFAEAMAAHPMSLDTYLTQLAVIQAHDATDRLARINLPRPVLAGAEDILIPVRLSKKLQKALPGAAWATVPGGHACLWKSPEPYATIFITYARSQS